MKGIILDLKDISDSREVMESKEPRQMRWFIYIVFIILITAFVFSYFFKIDEYTKVSGEVKTSDAKSNVISSANGKIKEIRVSEGQSVKKGDILFLLDVEYLKNKKEILDDMIEGYNSDIENTELLKKSIEDGTNYFNNDASDEKFYSRYEQYANGMQLSNQDIRSSDMSSNYTRKDTENKLETVKENISDKEDELSEYEDLLECMLNDEEYTGDNTAVTALYSDYSFNYKKSDREYQNYLKQYEELKKQYDEQGDEMSIQESQLEDVEDSYKNAEFNMQGVKNTYINQVKVRTDSLKTEISSLKTTRDQLDASLENIPEIGNKESVTEEKYKNEALSTIISEIDTLNEKISNLKSQLSELEEAINNSEIKASLDGTVTLVGELNEGDVVQAGSSLCSIVPSTDDMKIMLYVPENEVSKLKVGQKTEYVINSMPYEEYGKITGEITSISADSIANEKSGIKYFLAEATLSANSLSNAHGNVREVKNGMLLEAKTISGSKRVITWLLEKINFID